jgi:hypothetical protein
LLRSEPPALNLLNQSKKIFQSIANPHTKSFKIRPPFRRAALAADFKAPFMQSLLPEAAIEAACLNLQKD